MWLWWWPLQFEFQQLIINPSIRWTISQKSNSWVFFFLTGKRLTTWRNSSSILFFEQFSTLLICVCASCRKITFFFFLPLIFISQGGTVCWFQFICAVSKDFIRSHQLAFFSEEHHWTVRTCLFWQMHKLGLARVTSPGFFMSLICFISSKNCRKIKRIHASAPVWNSISLE